MPITTAQENAGFVPTGDVVSAEASKMMAGSAVEYATDGFDLLILSLMLRAITPALGLDPM